jgi:WD40 repeat protein
VFSPDCRTVLTAAFNRAARLWDAQTGAPIGEPFAHQGPVNVVAFAPGGRTILTGSYDRSARLWDVATALPIGPPIVHDGAVLAGAFSQDGRRSLTVSEHKLLQICTLPAPVEGDVERVMLWSQVATGMELSSSGTLRALEPKEWDERRRRLSTRGGLPGSG